MRAASTTASQSYPRGGVGSGEDVPRGPHHSDGTVALTRRLGSVSHPMAPFRAALGGAPRGAGRGSRHDPADAERRRSSAAVAHPGYRPAPPLHPLEVHDAVVLNFTRKTRRRFLVREMTGGRGGAGPFSQSTVIGFSSFALDQASSTCACAYLLVT